MRLAIQSIALAMIAALTAAVLLLQPGCETALAQQSATLPSDLALVPADAVGFAHIRGADLWKHEMFAGLRATFEKAGPKAIATLDKQFVPKPSTFERFTGFVLLDERKEPLPYGILRFSEPFEIAEVVTAYLPKASAEKIEGKTLYRGEKSPFELYFPDHQHIVIGMSGQMANYLKHELPKTGPLSYGLKLAASGKPIVVAANIPAIPKPEHELKGLPPEVKSLLNAEHITASLDLGASMKLELVAGFKTTADAQEAERAVKALAELGRKEIAKLKEEVEKKLFDPMTKSPRSPDELPTALVEVFALGGINQLDEMLANPESLIKRVGAQLTANITLPKEVVVAATGLATMSVGLLLPAVQKVRMAAARATTTNNMKQIALACHNYNDANGHLPHDITDKDGKPLLSWRVAILPYIEQANLYNQFKLDEPWDSEHNKKWSSLAIKTYMSPNANPNTPPGMTQYKGFAGPGAIFEPGKKIRLVADIPDGTSNTILFVEAGDPIPWAKPGDIPFDPKKPLPKLALPGVDGFVNAALCDGSVRTISMKSITEKTLKNAITRDDGEILGADW
jgi:hypothetical protein